MSTSSRWSASEAARSGSSSSATWATLWRTRWWWSLPPTNRRWCASRPRSPPPPCASPPSVFPLLPRLLERAGTSPCGSITGLYTVLVDGDDMNEPIADAARSILDGHIVLTRSLAHAGHYPAIDVLHSVSRLIGEIVDPGVRAAGQRLLAALAAYREKEDLISIGAYQQGTDPLLDAAITLRPRIGAF